MVKTNAILVGTAIGDALGMPFERMTASHPKLLEWNGSFKPGNFHKLEAGQWTDDTQMSIALSKSLIANNGYVPEDVAKEYLAWFKSGDCRGIGSTTSGAMLHLDLGGKWNRSGAKGVHIAGNGTAMRACPIGIVYRDDLHSLVNAAQDDASITHASFEPEVASSTIALVAAHLCNGVTPLKIVSTILSTLPPSGIKTILTVVQRLLDEKVEPALALRLISGAGSYVIDTVGMALYCVASCTSFKDTVVMAVRSGGDTDTTAAIAGGLAGSFYGLEGIPADYCKQLEKIDLLVEMDRALFQLLPKDIVEIGVNMIHWYRLLIGLLIVTGMFIIPLCFGFLYDLVVYIFSRDKEFPRFITYDNEGRWLKGILVVAVLAVGYVVGNLVLTTCG